MSNEKPFDPTKPVQTRDGRPARIICTDARHKNPSFRVWALVENDKGDEYTFPYSEEGKYLSAGKDSLYDLVNVPERKVETRKIIRNKVRRHEFGHFATSSMACSGFVRDEDLFGYLDFHTEDGELVNVTFRPKEG